MTALPCRGCGETAPTKGHTRCARCVAAVAITGVPDEAHDCTPEQWRRRALSLHAKARHLLAMHRYAAAENVRLRRLWRRKEKGIVDGIVDEAARRVKAEMRAASAKTPPPIEE